MNGQFLVAKYVQDLERREPRNIGVIVWTKGAVAHRFIEPEAADFVDDGNNYSRWIEHWGELCQRPRLQLFNDPAVTSNSPRFLKALQKTQRGNYLLDMGGAVTDTVTKDNVKDAAKFLFSRIVAPIRTVDGDRAETLDEKCMKFLSQAGVASRLGFQRRYPVRLSFDGFEQEIHFDFGAGEGKPALLFNRVNLAKEDSVTLAAGKCQTSIARGACTRQQCFSLFDSEDDSNEPALHFLKSFSEPLDIRNLSAAFLALAL